MDSYQKIELSDYTRSGEGGTAVSYTHKTRNTLAKLYNPGFEADRAKAEFYTARTVFEMGLPTPEPLRLVTDGERYGAEYELVKGKRSFTRIISEEPGRLEEISLTFAEWARRLHATPVPPGRLRSYKEVLIQFYKEKTLVPEAYKQKALAFLETVPDAPTCLHGDLQIGNIITDGDRTLWIDVGEFSHGTPEWDISIMWIMGVRMGEERANSLFHLTSEQMRAHWNFFLPAYLGTSDPQILGQYTRRLIPYYAAKVPYVYDMAYHCALPADALQRIEQMMG
ncbi:MAG: TIGR02172 family protein [Bacteroidales bacterium]|nr:TIGR02172 family protein [Bacteroidales bacterium]